jgi:hypothetical protein
MVNSAILKTLMRYPRTPVLLVVLVALMSFVVHVRGHVSLFGGGDEGSYIAAGKLMSESFRFVFPDEAIELGKKYLPSHLFVPAGFRIHNDEVSPVDVVSGWNKGFPIFSIPMWLIAPEEGWKGVSPLACAVSIIVIYLVGAAIRSPLAGISAALLLATNWLQLWFSRYPMTEVLSQSLILLMLLCVVRFAHAPRPTTLVIFALLASFSSVVHFANVPMWGMLGVALCFQLLPFVRRDHPADGGAIWSTPLRSFGIDTRKIAPFVGAGALTLGIPLVATLSYWFADPGVQRYVRMSNKMVASSGRADQLFETIVVRLQNLALFIPPFFWAGLLLCAFLFILNRGVARRWWLLIGGLALASFLLIVSSGVGTPRVLYVARRNVPFVLPALCLMVGVAIDWGTSRLRQRWVSIGLAMTIVLGLCVQQLSAFYPFRNLDQGKGSLALASQVARALEARYTGRPQFLIVSNYGINLTTGLRYVRGVPIINFAPEVTPEVISRMLGDGIDLYFLDDVFRPIAQVAKTVPNTQLSSISTHVVWLGHANQVGPTDYPKISSDPNVKFYLYKIDTL